MQAGMILAVDPGLQDLGWAVVEPSTGRVELVGELHQVRDDCYDESVCRAQRIRRQVAQLREVAVDNACTTIAAEAMSFGGPPKARFAMAISLGLSWGGLASLAEVLGLELYELPPKVWQHAVLGRAADDRSKVDYDDVFRRLSRFVGTTTLAAAALAAIPKGRRNHALDAVGVGVCTAMRRDKATKIRGAR